MKFTTALSTATTAAALASAAPQAPSALAREAGTMRTALVTPLRAPPSSDEDVPPLPRPHRGPPPSATSRDAMLRHSFGKGPTTLKKANNALRSGASARKLEDGETSLPPEPPSKLAPKPKPSPEGGVEAPDAGSAGSKPAPKPKPAPPALDAVLRHLLGAARPGGDAPPKPKPSPAEPSPLSRASASPNHHAEEADHGLDGFWFAERDEVKTSVRASSKPEPKSKPAPKPAPGSGSSGGSEGGSSGGALDSMPFVGTGSSGATWDYYNPYNYPPLDYETLQAELALTATQHSQAYVQAYYVSLSAVRSQCYVDYMTYCPVAVAEPGIVDYNDDAAGLPFDGLFSDLISTLFPSTSTSSVLSNAIGSLSGFFFGNPMLSDTVTTSYITSSNSPSVTVIEVGSQVEDGRYYDDRRRGLHGHPHRLNDEDESKYKTSRDDSSSSGSSDSSVSAEEPSTTFTVGSAGGGDTLTSSWGAPPDDIFIAPLGFGAYGDACMYSNYYSLQSSCRASINDLYALHDAYTAEEEEAHSYSHHGGLLFLLLLSTGVLGGLHVLRRFGPEARKREDAHYIIAAIRTNPTLKAQVEAASGRTVPMLDASGTCGEGKLVRILGVIGLVFACTVITLHIARELVYVDADGEEHVPNALIVFLLMFAVTALSVAILRAVYVTYRHLTAPEQPVFASSSFNGGDNTGGRSGGARGFTRSVFRWGRDLLGSSRRADSGHYTPMHAPDSAMDSSTSSEGFGAEMQSISKTASALQHQQQQQQQQQQVPVPLYYTGVPVTAPMAMPAASFVPITSPQPLQQQQQPQVPMQRVVFASGSVPVQMHSNVAMI